MLDPHDPHDKEYVVYFLNNDRPLYWLGGCRFSPGLTDALKFKSLEQAGQTAESDPEYPSCNGIIVGVVAEHMRAC